MQIINLSAAIRQANPLLDKLVTTLEANALPLGLQGATFYHDFPIYRDDAGELLRSQGILASSHHGLILFDTTDAATADDSEAVEELGTQLDVLFSTIYSRLLRSKLLQASRTQLAVPVNSAIYAPHLPTGFPTLRVTSRLLQSQKELSHFLDGVRQKPIPQDLITEIRAVIEGAKGLVRPKVRHLAGKPPDSLARLVSRLESTIATFDIQQRDGYITDLNGPQRIRGLAGSGKTVVLSMKAALTHLRNPEATILYTFYTKSLYQHIKRSITRFYRQFDDRDPDWDRIRILHAWGGASLPGVYYDTCVRSGVEPMTFGTASAGARDPFDAACSDLLNKSDVLPYYDYVFIDEGQDFPASFVRLCASLARDRRFVLAYDDLQTIFRPSTPTAAEIFGTSDTGESRLDFEEDIVLKRCYRNPREVLVVAHALGFGVYGDQIVQMLEDERHWEDIGYRVTSGTFKKGETVVIERPAENSLTLVSEALRPDQIVASASFTSMDEEVHAVATSIKADIENGLRPDDVLVACVDDRNAREYLKALTFRLRDLGIDANNIHTDSYGLKDFYLDDNVTLSTVHKAKGNEAFVVYVVGVDALFVGRPGVRERNILFTAMTRAKGLVRVSGLGAPAERCRMEIATALSHYPSLRFTYPGSEEMKRIRRDWRGGASKRRRDAEKTIEQLLDRMDPDELMEYLHRGLKSRNRQRRNSNDQE